MKRTVHGSVIQVCCGQVQHKANVAAFDLDGTLIVPKSGASTLLFNPFFSSVVYPFTQSHYRVSEECRRLEVALSKCKNGPSGPPQAGLQNRHIYKSERRAEQAP